MRDRTAASAGFVLAGVALAATLRGWPRFEVALALSALALVAFGLRRYDRLDRRPAIVVAGLAGIGAAVAAGVGFVAGGQPPAAAITLVGAAGAAIAALADWLGLDRTALGSRGRTAALGAVVGVAGIVMLYVWGNVLALLAYVLLPGTPSPQTATALSTLALGGGTLTVAAAYLRWSDRDVSFIDVRWPSIRHLGYVVLGVAGVVGANLGIGLLFREFGVQAASHTVVETAQSTGEPGILLVLIPLSYLVIAPGEELLYRNVIQKALREVFSPVGGVVVASAIFAAVHLPAYSSPGATLQATLNTLGIVFALALVLGAVYERTENLVVPVLVHGTFNAIAFAATYYRLTGIPA